MGESNTLIARRAMKPHAACAEYTSRREVILLLTDCILDNNITK
ncbi:hypothetical protein SAMN05444421_101466 [Celeribacter marinus]|nr:hypothetical protein SAMN05444421_101466 [Celeribacter marinus]